jgi:hypothetical protein
MTKENDWKNVLEEPSFDLFSISRGLLFSVLFFTSSLFRHFSFIQIFFSNKQTMMSLFNRMLFQRFCLFWILEIEKTQIDLAEVSIQ